MSNSNSFGWITWGFLDVLCTYGQCGFFPFSHSTDFNAPAICFKSVPSTGASVLNAGKVLAFKVLSLWRTFCLSSDFSSCIKFLFTLLLSLNTEGPPLFTVLYFTTECNLGLKSWCTEWFSLRQGTWLLNPVPDCMSQDLKNSISVVSYVEHCSVSLQGKTFIDGLLCSICCTDCNWRYRS